MLFFPFSSYKFLSGKKDTPPLNAYCSFLRKKVFFLHALSRENKLCFFLLFCIFAGNFLLLLSLPPQIDLLGLKTGGECSSLVLTLGSSCALFSLCAFCFSLKKRLKLISLSVLALMGIGAGFFEYFFQMGQDTALLSLHLKYIGNIYPLPKNIFLFFFAAITVCFAVSQLQRPETAFKKQKYFLPLPLFMLFLTLLMLQSYHFRHVEINHFITGKTGLLASFAGKNGQLRLLRPLPHKDIKEWAEVENASLQTDDAGQRTALLLRREFPGLIGEISCLTLLQFSTAPQKKTL